MRKPLSANQLILALPAMISTRK